MRLLKRPEVEAKTTLKRSNIYARMQAGTFPLAVKVGSKGVAWIESEVDSWIESRVAARDAAKNGEDI